MTIGAHDATRCPTRSSCMATQNPIESEGTYPLPEAQVDRFMLKILVDYPAHDEELTVVAALARARRRSSRRRSRSRSCARCSAQVADVYVDPALVSYAVDARDRDAQARPTYGLAELADYISFGASPRGPISLVAGGARARAPPRPRLRASPTTCSALAKDALRHRLVLSYQALAEERERRRDPRRGARRRARCRSSTSSRPSAA